MILHRAILTIGRLQINLCRYSAGAIAGEFGKLDIVFESSIHGINKQLTYSLEDACSATTHSEITRQVIQLLKDTNMQIGEEDVIQSIHNLWYMINLMK